MHFLFQQRLSKLEERFRDLVMSRKGIDADQVGNRVLKRCPSEEDYSVQTLGFY
jgi:hypothetical protein